MGGGASEEILGVTFRSKGQARKLCNPREQPLDHPTSPVSAQSTFILIRISLVARCEESLPSRTELAERHIVKEANRHASLTSPCISIDERRWTRSSSVWQSAARSQARRPAMLLCRKERKQRDSTHGKYHNVPGTIAPVRSLAADKTKITQSLSPCVRQRSR
jgi:hypothetical protein